MSGKQIFGYCSIIFVASWLLQIIAIMGEGGINAKSAEPWLVATMFIPLLVTTGFLIRYKDLRSKLLWKPRLNVFPMIFIAAMVPTLIAFFVIIVVETAGYGQSGWFTFSTSGVNISGGPYLLGIGDQPWLVFVANIIVTGLAYSLFNAIPAAGEEFAWRGFLQPVLTQKLSYIKGIALLGFIWSMWHLPGQLAGYNFAEYPVLGSLILSPLELIAVSFFLGWLTVKSGSFVPAAVAHGAGNSIREGIIENINMHDSRLFEDITTMVITVGVGLIFLPFLRKE